MTMPPSEPTGRPPVHVLLDVGQAATDLQHLVMMDRMWTEVADQSAGVDDRGRETLLAVGNRIYDGLGVAERHVLALQAVFAAHGPWVDGQLARQFSADVLAPEHLATVERAIAVTDGRYADRGLALCASVLERLPAERDDIRAKTSPLRGGGPVATDISDETACAVLALGTMGSTLLCPETGISCVGAVAGIVLLATLC